MPSANVIKSQYARTHVTGRRGVGGAWIYGIRCDACGEASVRFSASLISYAIKRADAHIRHREDIGAWR